MIALLRGRGADPNHTNGHGRSPLDLARLLGDYDAARFFADLLHPPTPTKPSILEMLTAPSSIRLRIDQANSLVSRSHNVEGSELAIEWSDVISFGFTPYLRDYDIVFRHTNTRSSKRGSTGIGSPTVPP